MEKCTVKEIKKQFKTDKKLVVSKKSLGLYLNITPGELEDLQVKGRLSSLHVRHIADYINSNTGASKFIGGFNTTFVSV